MRRDTRAFCNDLLARIGHRTSVKRGHTSAGQGKDDSGQSMLWRLSQDLAERLSTVQMSAAIPEVPGARLGTLGRCLGGKPVKHNIPRVLHGDHQCSLTLKGHGTFTASARSQLCKSRQLPLQTHPPDHARAQGRSRRSLLTLRASLVPDGSCGGQGRPLFTAPQRDSAAPGKSSHCVVNFYHLTDIEHPHKMHREHITWMLGKDIMGRIYISTQGINAQYSGLREDAVAYAQWVAQQQHFQGLHWTAEDIQGHQFPKLRLKVRPNLVQLAGGTQQLPICDPEARASPLSPTKWQEMLRTAVQPAALHQRGAEEAQEGSSPGAVVLDVRNAYEWDAGHFIGAERPLEDSFNETPTEAPGSEELPAHLQNVSPDTPVMMYCTGGIRCDIYSAYLRKKGFNNLYTLEKGVQNYMKQEGTDLWEGSLFVFDGRMAIRPGNEDGSAPETLPAATSCALCGGEPELPHLNCANIDCNKLFLACPTCKAQHKGCCCEACLNAPRLVRRANGGGNYARWLTCAREELQNLSAPETRAQRALRQQQTAVAKRIAEGRSDGRTRRRLLRKERMNERTRLEREEHTKRRQMVKEALARQEQAAEAAQSERLALDLTERLSELRESRERRQQSLQLQV